MKRVIHLLISISALHLLLLGIGCKKDKVKKDTDNDTKGLYSFSNTEYTGLANVGNHYFPRPLSLRFGEGNDVTAWSHLTLSVWRRGDVHGKITKVEEGAQGQTTVTILFDLPGDEQFNSPQVYTISADKSKITGGTSPIISMADMKLFPKDAPSIVGAWAQPDHPEWFPDVNVIYFVASGVTNYKQNGKFILGSFEPPTNYAQIFKQDGSRIIFFGVNPDVAAPLITYIPYYGVLSSDGKILYVDAYEFSAAHISTSLSTFPWYGPRGTTPWLIRQ